MNQSAEFKNKFQGNTKKISDFTNLEIVKSTPPI